MIRLLRFLVVALVILVLYFLFLHFVIGPYMKDHFMICNEPCKFSFRDTITQFTSNKSIGPCYWKKISGGQAWYQAFFVFVAPILLVVIIGHAFAKAMRWAPRK